MTIAPTLSPSASYGATEDEKAQQEEEEESSHLLHDHQHSSHESLRLEEDVPFYAPPRQRQRWDDHQVLPHVNWGDLFWDLFYVSGAFNLAASLKESLNGLGILYFFACYYSILNIWSEKITYDSRFVPDDNLFHRSLEIVHIVFLGTIIASIKPVQVMSDTHNQPETLLFCACLVINYLLLLVRQLDIFYNARGGPESKHQARQEILVRAPSFVLHVVATAWAAQDYFWLGQGGHAAFWNVGGWLHHHASSHGEERSLFVEEEEEEAAAHISHVIVTNHGPIILCLIASLSVQFCSLLWRFIVVPFYLGVTSHKQAYVPINIEFILHRQGEWTMLMLGESVLALLIVEQSAGMRYYVTFYSGIITVTLFQYLYFRSHPFEPDDHALRRSSSGGFTFYLAQTIYSASLILVGCSYKMILHYYLEEEEALEEGEFENDEDHERSIANLFSWSMALSFVTLDIMIITHRGWRANFSRFVVNGKCAIMPLLITILNYTLIVAVVLLSRWVEDLETLVAIGLLIVAAEVVLRTRGLRYFPVSKSAMRNLGA